MTKEDRFPIEDLRNDKKRGASLQEREENKKKPEEGRIFVSHGDLVSEGQVKWKKYASFVR